MAVLDDMLFLQEDADNPMLLRACQAFVERIQELEEQLDAIKEQS